MIQNSKPKNIWQSRHQPFLLKHGKTALKPMGPSFSPWLSSFPLPFFQNLVSTKLSNQSAWLFPWVIKYKQVAEIDAWSFSQLFHNPIPISSLKQPLVKTRSIPCIFHGSPNFWSDNLLDFPPVRPTVDVLLFTSVVLGLWDAYSAWTLTSTDSTHAGVLCDPGTHKKTFVRQK